MIMKKKLLILTVSLLCCGCFSSKPHNLSISAAYPFEGRYDSSAKIEIEGNKAEVRKEDSLWILSNHTLYNLLVSVSDSPDKITFGNGRTYTFSKKGVSLDPIAKDAFDDEEYVWQTWTIPTNGVR